jgi:hypothetical protein
MKGGSSMSDMDREKFKRIAEKRVNNVIKMIRLIGNLSNKSNYSYTEKDVDRIFNSINQELKTCRNRFEDVQKVGSTFKLD